MSPPGAAARLPPFAALLAIGAARGATTPPVPGMERFGPLRPMGPGRGAAAVVPPAAPRTSLPDGAANAFVLVAKLPPAAAAPPVRAGNPGA